MATKAKIRKKKKDAPAPSVSNIVDNKELENTDKTEKDPVLVKTAPDSNILDTVSQESIKDDEEEEIKIVNDVNKNDDPQKKKDGIYEKRDQEKDLRSTSPSQLSVVSASRRSPSPFKRNVVEPAPDDGTASNLGSAVSLRSNISAKEAWSDTGSISKSETKKSKSKVSTTPVNTIDSNKNMKPDDTVSLVSRATLNAEQNQNAYIPYVQARNCIKQITRDMENMKISHVRIVHDIEKNYRAIEDEAQNQFNMFILSLKQQYIGKVKTFKQVVEVHRVDLESKETYWQNVFKSLTERNNKILREKKAFLIKHKLEIERLIKEKETLKTELTNMVDKANSESKQVEKDYAEKMEKESTSHKTVILQLEEEKKILQDELERERKEKDRLNRMILEGQSGSVVPFIDAITSDTTKEEGESEIAMPVLTVAAGREEKEQMEDEREQMSKERLDLLEERQMMEEERKKFSEERKVFVNEMSSKQEEINQSRKISAEWEAKYNSLKTDFGESLTLQVKYKALENQYIALSAIVASDTASSTKAAIENEEKSKSEKDMMETEKKRLENEIAEWEKEFQKKHNRSPVEEDKSDSAKELYTTLEEVNTMVESLDKKIETFHKVQNGNVPDVPEVSAVPFVVKDPEIRTVEVTVPDPTILATLAKCQEEIEQLKCELSESQREKTQLNSTLSEVNTDLLSSKTKITELETQLALEKEDVTMQQSAVPIISSASTEEIEDLRKKLAEKEKELEKLREENNEMLKDMKKMVKRYNKLDEKLKASSAAAMDSQLLQVVAAMVKDLHSEVPAASERVNQRVVDVTADENIKEKDKELQLQALQIIQNGAFVGEDTKQTQSDSKEVENKITELEERVIDLESENDVLKKEKEEKLEKIEETERELSYLKNQASLLSVTKTSEDDESQKQVLELQAEKSDHDKTKTELENVQKQMQEVQEDLTNKKVELETELQTIKKKLDAEVKAKEEELKKLNARNDELEKERLSNVPLDSANEIKALQKRISVLEKEKKELDSVKVGTDSKVDELQSKLDQAVKNLNTHKASNKELETKIKAVRTEKEKAVKDLTSQLEKKDQEKLVLERKKTFVGKGAPEKGGTDAAAKALKEQLQAAKRENTELNNRIKQLEKELSKSSKSDADAVAMDKLTKRHEKILKELEKKYEMEKSKNERNTENLKEKEEEIKSLNKDCNNKNIEIKKLQAELETLGEAAKEGVEAAVKVKALEADNKHLIGENKILSENFNSERILRKKYYNMVEDMKGKIRVYCRARPLSTSEKERGNVSVINSPDEYSLHITTSRGLKEFQYDQVFMENSSQEQVFADTNNLIQSAVDGYNVCMFAYGQTGSGKTFTMIGDREQRFPGIAPRAFQRIFELAEENKSKFDVKVSTYMLELYNDKLIDLFAAGSSYDEDRLDIKKDKKGMVVVQGSVIKEATNSKELFALFEEGSKNRHVASTKMNAESSRSHLIIGIVMESTNKVTGQILKGKLSLVDLAGSERVGKTGATAEQLKEAMSINKSLSALGDVISALSSEQSFIPYRNNKLTMLMQDSLGGNAKTLMFVNISPADYNQDESVISLTYASRVKLITNDASKNADNKEIARLKNIIQKLKQGEAIDEED